MSWTRRAREHYDRAYQDSGKLANVEEMKAWALTEGLFALVAVQLAQTAELRKIRRALEAHLSNNDTVRLNLTGRLVSKEGIPMPAGPFNPTEAQDVEFAISPVNAAGQPTSGPFNWTPAGLLTVSADTKSAKFVTPPGDLDLIVAVTDPRTGAVDTAQVQRTAEPPPDNNTVAMNLSGSVVDKAPPPTP